MGFNMKDYLEKQTDGSYVMKSGFALAPADWIEIPKGMNYAYKDEFNIHFTTLEMGYRDSIVIWQRESPNDKLASAEQYRQAEVLPFIDDEPKSEIEQTLAQRQSQYGCFEDVAFVTQGMIELMRKCNYDKMPASHQMALSMICSKMARIVNGDFNFIENWHDISGYATLVENKLMVTDGAKNSRLVYQKVIDGKLQDI